MKKPLAPSPKSSKGAAMQAWEPVYLETHRRGLLKAKIAAAYDILSRCDLCPRNCLVDRHHGELGLCRTGDRPVVSSYSALFGEEDPLVGGHGSGTIFFTHCNLYFIFCQNYEISHGGEGEEISVEDLAAMMLLLQNRGCHNINFVTPSHVVPLTFHVNYGRGINSVDARVVVQHPADPRLATTDFYQAGTSSNFGRLSLTTDVFLIDHSNEQVYIPDDGSFEFKGPSRAYGYEAKLSVALTRHLALNGGLTKIGNAFYKGGDHRAYVDSAPHFVANAALTLAGWHGWSGSLRMRAINHYRLDGDDPSIVASGHTVFDLGMAKAIRRGIEFNLSLDNLTNRDYYETQNYFDSRVTPLAPIVGRIHGTPGYPLTAIAGLTFRLRGK